MADINLQIQRPAGADGVDLSYRTAAQVSEPITTSDTFRFPNSGHEYVLIKRGAASVDVTIQTGVVLDGLAVADRVVTVPANTDRLIGPFKPEIYNDSAGEVVLTFSAASAISVAVLRF